MTLYLTWVESFAMLAMGLTLVGLGILLDELWRWYDETHRRH